MMQAYKPNSVSRLVGMAIIYLDLTLLLNSSGLPKTFKANNPDLTYLLDSLLHDLAPSGVYTDPDNSRFHFWTSVITNKAVGSYPAFSPLSHDSGTVFFLLHFP